MPSIKIQLLAFSFYYVNWGMGCEIYIFAQLHSNVLKLVIHQNTYTTLHSHSCITETTKMSLSFVHCNLIY